MLDEAEAASHPDWWDNACFQRDPTWEVYASAFLDGARVLRDEVLERHGLADSIAFPLVFCYRHHVELALKNLIATGKQLIGDPGSFAKLHGLHGLWNECRPVLMQLDPPPEPADLDRAERTILQLDQLDPAGETFRYPVGKQKGRPATLLPQDLRFNVRQFSEEIEAVAGILRGASEMVAVYLEFKNEAADD